MALPAKTYYSLQEAAARWGCTLSDIAGWASADRFDIAIGIVPPNAEIRRSPGLSLFRFLTSCRYSAMVNLHPATGG